MGEEGLLASTLQFFRNPDNLHKYPVTKWLFCKQREVRGRGLAG